MSYLNYLEDREYESFGKLSSKITRGIFGPGKTTSGQGQDGSQIDQPHYQNLNDLEDASVGDSDDYTSSVFEEDSEKQTKTSSGFQWYKVTRFWPPKVIEYGLSMISLGIAWAASKMGRAGYAFNAIVGAPFALANLIVGAIASPMTHVVNPVAEAFGQKPVATATVVLLSVAVVAFVAIAILTGGAMFGVPLLAAMAGPLLAGISALTSGIVGLLGLSGVGAAIAGVTVSVGSAIVAGLTSAVTFNAIRANLQSEDYSVVSDVREELPGELYTQDSPLTFEQSTDSPQYESLSDLMSTTTEAPSTLESKAQPSKDLYVFLKETAEQAKEGVAAVNPLSLGKSDGIVKSGDLPEGRFKLDSSDELESQGITTLNFQGIQSSEGTNFSVVLDHNKQTAITEGPEASREYSMELP